MTMDGGNFLGPLTVIAVANGGSIALAAPNGSPSPGGYWGETDMTDTVYELTDNSFEIGQGAP